MFTQYFQNILNTLKRGDASEVSFYTAIETLLKDFAKSQKQIAEITIIPKKTKAGIPDFVIRDKNLGKIGHIEAKDFQKYPESHDLDIIEDSAQLQKYRKNFANLILTNFFEFRLYRHGALVEKAWIGRPFIAYQLKTLPPIERKEDLEKLLKEFFAFSIPETKSAKSLALELAGRTAFLKEKILEEIEQQNANILDFFQAFKKHLISSLTYEQFTNLYAQTITYGLFAARTRSSKPASFLAGKNEFKRHTAVNFIPKTIPLLKRMFAFISSSDLPQSMEWIVDEIAQVLALTDVAQIMHDFYQQGKGKDPIVHFYETFLAEYDPMEREKRGVYYTPEPVVSYIAGSINKILKEKFDKPNGFASSQVTVLDPAAGTLTFPAKAIRIAKQEIQQNYGPGVWQNLVKEHILKNFYGFEILMAPYAIAHLKISLLLAELGYKMADDDIFKLYLTNTLEMKIPGKEQLPGIFEKDLAQEFKRAKKVKEEIPIMVIMGNPPYSGASENKGKWILEQIKEYKQIKGEPLRERNSKWIQDDYVKFFRFAQWKIERAGAGILGFITNHAWLDNPTFRGMRYSLRKTFDEIYIFNLHGSSLKKEKTASGGKDENVFDIQAGVAIAIMVKLNQVNSQPIKYFDLYGLREEKYKFLETHTIENTKWQTLKSKEPYYFFVPQKIKGRKEYESFWKITDIFPVNSVGIVTARDKFVIDSDRLTLEARIRIFRESSDSDEFIKLTYGLEDKANWKIKNTRKELRKLDNREDYFVKILYRPFDERWIYYHPSLIERHREEVMKHMMRPNLALITTRQQADSGFYHCFVADKITESCFISNKTREIGYSFPLYLYNGEEIKSRKKISSNIMMLFDKPKQSYAAKKPNINPKLLEELNRKYNKKPTPEDIFYYIYAIFYSNIYRQKYQEFLRIDFPRVPFFRDYQLFKKMSKLGSQLVDLHLLKSNKLNSQSAKFYGQGDNTVKFRKYNQEKQRLYINDKKYFEPITKEIWEYMIGGYQVLDKWIKDKTGKNLSVADIKHFCQISTSLSETIKIQKQIDKIYLQKKLLKY